ncbi:MAG: hypothetical protein SV775_06545 [Thermodesulfobacteriota bacterium]|nr:hypothetical protein [Thermodesulfobacteriota bacterium]
MNKRIVSIGTALALVLGLLLIGHAPIKAQECQLISIKDGDKTIRLHPVTSHISEGTCVIWVNWSSRNVNIMFEEGKMCESVVDASMDFKLDENNCFITQVNLSKGDTASLVYEKKGTFEYIAMPESGKKVTGKIGVH